MRLLLETPDRSPYWLVGDPALNERTEHSSSMADQIQVTRNQQVVNGSDWDSVLGLDRGNQQVVITATTRREFASEIERMDFLSALAATSPVYQLHRWAGRVIVRVDSADGETYRDYTLPDAIVTLVSSVPEAAVGLKLTYQVKSGGFGQGVSGGANGDICNLTTTTDGRAHLEIDDAAISVAIAAELTNADDGVVELGLYRQAAHPTTGVLGTPFLESATLLFFEDASAYNAYLGSSLSMYAPVNVGSYQITTPQWSYYPPAGGGVKFGCAGFTLPFSRCYRFIAPPKSLGAQITFGDFLFGQSRDGKMYFMSPALSSYFFSNGRVWTLRISKLVTGSSGIAEERLSAPIATLQMTPPGEVQLTAITAAGTLHNLTAYVE